MTTIGGGVRTYYALAVVLASCWAIIDALARGGVGATARPGVPRVRVALRMAGWPAPTPDPRASTEHLVR